MKIQVGKIITEEEDEEERDLVMQDRPIDPWIDHFFWAQPIFSFLSFLFRVIMYWRAIASVQWPKSWVPFMIT